MEAHDGPPLDERQRGLGDDAASAPRRRARPRARREPSRAPAARLRNDLISVSSSSLATTTRRRVLAPGLASSSTACFVDGASKQSPSTRPSVPAWAWSVSAARSAALRGLLVHLDRRSRAARGREGDAAARELRRADRALAGAAGALLAPRLRAAARDEPAALRGPRALRGARSAPRARPRARGAA